MAFRPLGLIVAAFVVALSMLAAPAAQAQNYFSYVSSLQGDDRNDCAAAVYTSGNSGPCQTTYYAITKTIDGGNLICVDPGDHVFALSLGSSGDDFTVNITQGITIDCQAGGGARDIYSIVVNAPGKQVVLRNLTVNPRLFSDYENRPAIKITAAASVDMENVVVTGSNNIGISDARSTPGAKLAIRNSVISGHSGPGIVVVPQGNGTTSVVLDNVNVRDTSYGLAVGARARVMVNRSVFAQNVLAGIEADPGGVIDITDTLISNSQTGIIASTGSSITLAGTGVNSNNTAISGATRSYGNNRFFANAASIGTAPTPIGTPSFENGLR